MAINTIYPILKDVSDNTLEILKNIVNPTISRKISGTYEFNAVVYDVTESLDDQIIEAEGQDYRIVYTEEQSSDDGKLLIGVKAEHISYELVDTSNTLDSFAALGTPTDILTSLLSGTGFTVGTVDFGGSIAFSINEQVTVRRGVYLLAQELGGEVDFDNKVVSIVTQLGSNNGYQFRPRKGLKGLNKIRDKRSGTAITSYKLNIVELREEETYKRLGYSNLETFGLGDTVQVIEDRTETNVTFRIVEYSYNVVKRINSSVVVANEIDDYTDSVLAIQVNGLYKGKNYNKVSISAEDGFVSVRDDNKAKMIANATDGFELQSDTGSGLQTNFSVDVNGKIQAKEIVIDGSGEFQGSITAGTINIGTNFDVDALGNMTANNATIDGNVDITSGSISIGANFDVDNSGNMTANNVNIDGDVDITSGSITIGANFEVDSSGNMTASNADFQGDITGSIITGGTFRTSASGERIEISNDDFQTYNSSNQLNGIQIEAGKSYNALDFRENGTLVATLQYTSTLGLDLAAIGNDDVTISSGNSIIQLDNSTGNIEIDTNDDLLIDADLVDITANNDWGLEVNGNSVIYNISTQNLSFQIVSGELEVFNNNVYQFTCATKP